MCGRGEAGALSVERRALVRENLGLVGLHIRRNVRGRAGLKRRQVWEDLFQEGVLGLIRAAGQYDPESGIPFAAFALPRIHYAVSLALRTRLAETPSRGVADHGHKEVGGDRHDPRGGVRALRHPERIADRRGMSELEVPVDVTVGQRLREKYEQAVRDAAARVSVRRSTRGDLGDLVRRLVDERLMVPEDEARRSLRKIAFDTRSSWARVTQCDAELTGSIRSALEADPEFGELRRVAREDPQGVERAVDAAVERRLGHAGADAFVRRFRAAGVARRSELLARFLDLSSPELERMMAERFSAMPEEARAEALRGSG